MEYVIYRMFNLYNKFEEYCISNDMIYHNIKGPASIFTRHDNKEYDCVYYINGLRHNRKCPAYINNYYINGEYVDTVFN